MPWVPGCMPVAIVAALTRVTVGKTEWLFVNSTPSPRSRKSVGVSSAVIASGRSPSTTNTITNRLARDTPHPLSRGAMAPPGRPECLGVWGPFRGPHVIGMLPRMTTHALYLVRMDVAHDHEATFNEVYDKEHAPNLRGVPGVRRASRYRQASATEPRYFAAYELDNAAVLQSAAWKAAGEAGRWPGEIRTHTMNRHLATYEW